MRNHSRKQKKKGNQTEEKKLINHFIATFFIPFLNHGRLIVVAVTLGLDNGYSGGVSNAGNISETSDTIGVRLSNESFLLSLANQTSDDAWSSSGDDSDEEVVVVAELHALQEDHACENVLRLLLIIKTALLGISLLLEIFMARLALRGTMWDVHPRRFMEYVLYSRLRTNHFFATFSPLFLDVFFSVVKMLNGPVSNDWCRDMRSYKWTHLFLISIRFHSSNLRHKNGGKKQWF